MNLVDIIKACSESGVVDITIGDINISFDKKNTNNVAPISNFGYNDDTDDDNQKFDENVFDLEEIKLSDPEAYEKYILEENQ